jgi:alcohol dehydrogenase YqhD (iron-dependent ADH family)
MNNFEFIAPTRIYFGKGQVSKIGTAIKQYSSNILIAYGSGSIKKNGIYNDVVKVLKENNIGYYELSGIKPNPSVKSVREGVRLCREHQLDFILAIGGGSVIDCVKGIAAGVMYEGDPWDFYIYRAKVENAIPIGAVLTLSATGSEMNGGSVVSNEETFSKMAMGAEILRPRFSVLDPEYTFSVDSYHTAAGTADIMSHCFEQYFSSVNDTFLQDRLTEAVLKTSVHYGPIALEKPDNYDARANLMWASSVGLNGLLSTGKQGDWATHMIEHEFSALSDITHGIGLAIITPHWMKHALSDETMDRFVSLATNVWGIRTNSDYTTAIKGIDATAGFFRSIGIPMSLKEAGVTFTKEQVIAMAQKLVKYGPLGNARKLYEPDIVKIITECL